MKIKHRTYGKKAACCGFGSYHTDDSFYLESTIAALARRLLQK